MARKKSRRLTARTADKYVLYTEAVQSPEGEISFFKRVYKNANDRPPIVLREDFCGTAAICCKWVQKGKNNRSIGVDLDPEPLAWGKEHYVSKLNADQKKRLQFRQTNVLTVKTPPVDVIAALNFSFCVFKERQVLVKYMKRCHQALAKGGIMVMDIYGGPDSQKPAEESTRYNGFTYIWDQAAYNPITHEALDHIHFCFPNGTQMKKAFTYDWRLWTLAELNDALREAGFRNARVYWEGTDKKGEGNGVFTPRQKVENEDAWVAYIVGFK